MNHTNHFEQIKKALIYIDGHLAEPLRVEALAARFHFSPFYFHRIFTIIVGIPIAEHIRSRRLAHACLYLTQTDASVLSVGLDCGYQTAQSFTRAFKSAYGVSPSTYRKQTPIPEMESAEEMILRFTNRLQGGMVLHPKIIRQKALTIAGTCGDGNETGAVWDAFEELIGEKPLSNELSVSGYEVRLYNGDTCTVYVGRAVAGKDVDTAYAVYSLPASEYAVFDVYVANGYENENAAMDEWLRTNPEGYHERRLGASHYCVEYYDERFTGNEAGSIVEIWVPVERDAK